MKRLSSLESLLSCGDKCAARFHQVQAVRRVLLRNCYCRPQTGCSDHITEPQTSRTCCPCSSKRKEVNLCRKGRHQATRTSYSGHCSSVTATAAAARKAFLTMHTHFWLNVGLILNSISETSYIQ
jgi:hypothetical protein